jgi:hypothetical protein
VRPSGRVESLGSTGFHSHRHSHTPVEAGLWFLPWATEAASAQSCMRALDRVEVKVNVTLDALTRSARAFTEVSRHG